MTTTVTKTIKAGGDYTTLQAWEDATPANLVTADEVWKGVCSGAFTNSSGSILVLSGTTTDATRYIWLRPDTGQAFADNANVRTNALRWNSSNGTSITNSGSYSITINGAAQPDVLLEGLQIEATGTANAITSGVRATISACIVEAAKSDMVQLQSGTAQLLNSLICCRKSGATVVATISYGAPVSGCTFVTPSDLTKPSSGILNIGAASIIINTAAFWGAALKTGAGTPQYFTCANDNASPPSGVTQMTYDTSLFVNISDATRDFRAPSGSTLLGAGTFQGGKDISGLTRPNPPSIGCWDVTPASALAFKSKTVNQAVNRAATY